MPVSRLEGLLDRLESFYGRLPTPPRDPFGLAVWEILSAHGTPRGRDGAMAALKRARALTPDALFRAPQKVLADSVALAGAYREQRLHALRTVAELFRRKPGLSHVVQGPLSLARRAIEDLPRLADGSRATLLLFARDGLLLPLDPGVLRVGTRLGYGERRAGRAGPARTIRNALTRELPPNVEAHRRAFAYLSHHASATCVERGPHCAVCPIGDDCPEGGEGRRHG